MKPLAIVTAGPASEPVDDVRRITNSATGEIGALLTAELVARNFEVVLFRGRGATCTDAPPQAAVHEFAGNRDLALLLEELSTARADDTRAVFHAAALSDYAVTAVRGPGGAPAHERKIPGNLARVEIVLEPAAKVLPHLRSWFPRARITAWKYELDGSREDAVRTARAQIAHGRSHATVVNGAAYGPGFGVLEAENPPVHFAAKRELAIFLASRAAASANAQK